MEVTIEEAQNGLAELIERSASGEPVVITRREEPVAQLVPLSRASKRPVFGSCAGKLRVLAEIDEHLTDFSSHL